MKLHVYRIKLLAKANVSLSFLDRHSSLGRNFASLQKQVELQKTKSKKIGKFLKYWRLRSLKLSLQVRGFALLDSSQVK